MNRGNIYGEARVVVDLNHVACLIWLPDYPNANKYWDIPNDNNSRGWIWVEATGSVNPLGWTPPDFMDGNWNAYPIGSSAFIVQQPQPILTETIIIVIIALVVLLVLSVFTKLRKKRIQ